MEKSRKNASKISDVIVLVIVLAGAAIIALSLVTNITEELDSQSDDTSSLTKVEPTPYPTLTQEELEELSSMPVGEEGNQ